MHIKGPKEFSYGYNPITTMDDKEQNTLMNFGILRMKDGDVYENSDCLERAYLLVSGKVKLEYDGVTAEIERDNCFDYEPWVLHVSNNTAVKITALGESEWCVQSTDNENAFSSKLYTPEECASENRGHGTMREASTRIVRTVFDHSNAPYANLVVGEVIGFPGKWSSYPPHNHPQPEIYFYKFNPENGYGFAELDEDVIKTHNNSTVLITKGETHPQTTAPGYAMWYLWIIRHLENDPYITPYFIPEHRWVTDSANEKIMWPPEK